MKGTNQSVTSIKKEEGLKALLTYDGEMLNASVFDSEGERYVLFDMDPPGAFVAKKVNAG